MPNDWEIISTDVNRESASRHVDLRLQIARTNSRISWPDTDSAILSLLREKFRDRQRMFFAQSSTGEDLACVVARISPTIRDRDGRPLGMLGFFDSEDRQDISFELLNCGRKWLEEQKCQSIVGPMDGDTWHKYRLNVGPYDEIPFLLEPANPTYYPRLWIHAGFATVDTFHSKMVDEISSVISATKRSLDVASAAGYTFRPLESGNYESEIKIIFRLSRAIFKDNFLYDDISWDEFADIYASAKKLIEPKLVRIAVDADGEPVGFLFCLIDYFEAVQAMKGQKGWLAKIRFLLNKHRASAVNFKSLGVLPEHRRAQVATALMHWGYVESLRLGFRKANLCLIRDGNFSSRMDGGCGRIIRRYELYQTPGTRLKS